MKKFDLFKVAALAALVLGLACFVSCSNGSGDSEASCDLPKEGLTFKGGKTTYEDSKFTIVIEGKKVVVTVTDTGNSFDKNVEVYDGETKAGYLDVLLGYKPTGGFADNLEDAFLVYTPAQ